MRFQTELIPARLTRRYKRFLADCVLEGTGAEITAHCANPGSMMGLAEPGTRVWLEPNDDPKKKLKYGWRLVDHENGHFTGVDTALPNRLVKEALLARTLPPFVEFSDIRPEVKYGEKSRVDFLLRQDGVADMYVEVKSVTLNRTAGLAEFPDSVTARGAKHLDELTSVVAAGHRAAMFYLVQRTDCTTLSLAQDIDPAYAAAYRAARTAGVETFCFGTNVTPNGIDITDALKIDI
ncbi:MAG: DNA/RNA nuclease SfsA [Roseobacter sp.]